MSSYTYNGHDITEIFNPTTCQPPGGNAETVFGANSNYFQYSSSDIIGSNGASGTNTSDDYMGANADNYGNNLPYTVNKALTNIGNYLMVSHDGFGDVNNTYTIPSNTNANRIRVLLVGGGGGHGGSGGNAKCKIDIAGGNSAEGHGGRGGYGGVGARTIQKINREDLVNSTFAGNVTINLGSAGGNGNDGSTPSKKAIAGQVTKAHGNDGNAGGGGGESILSWTTVHNGLTTYTAAGGAGGGGGTGANAETKKGSNTSSKQGSPGSDSIPTNYGIFTTNAIANQTNAQAVETDFPNFSNKWIGNQSSNTWLTYGGGGYQTSNGSTRDKVNSSVNGNNGYAIIVFLYD